MGGRSGRQRGRRAGPQRPVQIRARQTNWLIHAIIMAITVCYAVAMHYVPVRVDEIRFWLIWGVAGTIVAVEAIYILPTFGRVTLTNDTLVIRYLPGITRSIPRDRISQVILVSQYDGSHSYSALLLLDARGKKLVKIFGYFYDGQRLKKMAQAIGPGEVLDLDSAEVAAHFPGVIPLWERNPLLYTAYVFIVVFAAVIVCFWIIFIVKSIEVFTQ